MPEIIPEDQVEATWAEVGAWPPSKALKEMNRVTSSQPAVAAYVMARTDSLSQDARELAVYMLLVVFRIFEKHCGPLRRIEVKTVERLERASIMDEVDDADDVTQPFVTASIEDCVFDSGDDGIHLTPKDQESLFLAMQVVIEAFSTAAD